MDTIRDAFVDDKEWIGDVEYLVIRDMVGSELSKSSPFVQFLLEPMEFDTEEERVRTARFLMGFPINDFLRSGAIGLGHSSSNGTVDGCLMVEQFDPTAKKGFFSSITSFGTSMLAYYRQSSTDGTPNLFTKKSMRPQMYQFFKVAKEADVKSKANHIEFGPKEQHLHVCQLAGTSREVEAKLLKRLISVAGDNHYIFSGASGDEHTKMLQDAGFEIAGKGDVVDPSDETRKTTMVSMVRAPSGKGE